MSTGYRVPATGNALGMLINWLTGTDQVADRCFSRHFDLRLGGIFNPSNSPEGLLTLDMGKYLQDRAKATQLAGGRSRIPASAWHQKPTSHPSIPSSDPGYPLT